jgi:hypothetical protein
MASGFISAPRFRPALATSHCLRFLRRVHLSIQLLSPNPDPRSLGLIQPLPVDPDLSQFRSVILFTFMSVRLAKACASTKRMLTQNGLDGFSGNVFVPYFSTRLSKSSGVAGIPPSGSVFKLWQIPLTWK